MTNFFISVTSHALNPLLPLSQTVTPSRTPSPLERDVLYGRPHSEQVSFANLCVSVFIDASELTWRSPPVHYKLTGKGVRCLLALCNSLCSLAKADVRFT